MGIAVTLSLAALAIAGCSSAGSSASAGGTTAAAATGAATATQSACMTKVNQFLKPWDTLPTTLPAAYTPLTKTVPAGQTVIRIVGPIPSDQDTYTAQVAAAKAIGWTPKEITEDGSVQGITNAFNQAISEKPTVITASIDATEIPGPLAAAKKAGILVSLSSQLVPATGTTGLAAMSNAGATTKVIGELNAYMFMRSSDCAGSVAVFNLPFPILKVGTDEFTATINKVCPACKVSYNLIQTADIGTPAATSAIVSALQSSPSTKYAYTVIGNLADGLETALNQAGMSGIRIFGQVPDDNSIAALRNSTNAWWIDQSSTVNGWTELDAALRVLTTGKPYNDTGAYPLAILTPTNVPAGTSAPTYPLNYEQEFTNLWHGKSA